MIKFYVFHQVTINGESALVPVTKGGRPMIVSAKDGAAALALLRRPGFFPVVEPAEVEAV